MHYQCRSLELDSLLHFNVSFIDFYLCLSGRFYAYNVLMPSHRFASPKATEKLFNIEIKRFFFPPSANTISTYKSNKQRIFLSFAHNFDGALMSIRLFMQKQHLEGEEGSFYKYRDEIPRIMTLFINSTKHYRRCRENFYFYLLYSNPNPFCRTLEIMRIHASESSRVVKLSTRWKTSRAI